MQSVFMLIVDPANGNMWTLDTEILLNKESFAYVDEPQLRFASLNEIPGDYKQYLIPLND